MQLDIRQLPVDGRRIGKRVEKDGWRLGVERVDGFLPEALGTTKSSRCEAAAPANRISDSRSAPS